MKVAPYLAGSSVSHRSTSLCPSVLALQETLLPGNLVWSTQTSLASSWPWLELWEFPGEMIQGQWRVAGRECSLWRPGWLRPPARGQPHSSCAPIDVGLEGPSQHRSNPQHHISSL